MEPSRTQSVTERARIPTDGLIFGFGVTVPFPLALLVVWLGAETWANLAAGLIVVWGAAILIFLSGVRRGLSFRTPGGPRTGQIAMVLWLFCAGLVALFAPVILALAILFCGYLSLMVLDPIAARHHEAPLYFVRLRPVQMAIPAASLGLTVVALWL